MSFLSLVGRRGRHYAVNIEEMEEEVSLTNLYLLKPTNWFYIFFFFFLLLRVCVGSLGFLVESYGILRCSCMSLIYICIS